VEWPAKRCYVGLVAVGVQEQAEDILVPPLLRNCLTLITFPFPGHYLPPQNSGPCNSLHCLGHSKNVYDDDDDDLTGGLYRNSIKYLQCVPDNFQNVISSFWSTYIFTFRENSYITLKVNLGSPANHQTDRQTAVKTVPRQNWRK